MLRRERVGPSLLAVVLFTVLGCQGPLSRLTMPSATTPPDTAAATDTVVVPPATVDPVHPDAPATVTVTGIVDPALYAVAGLTGGDSLVGVIDGALGGRLENRFVRLDVPAGAWVGRGTVTIRFPDPAHLRADLDIQPAALNHFAAAVELRLRTADCVMTSAPGAWWFDPVLGEWFGLTGSVYDGTSQELRVKLRHFSSYGAGGKAGW